MATQRDIPRVALFAGQVLTSRQLADRYGVTDVDGSRPDAWGYIAAYGIEEPSEKDVGDSVERNPDIGPSASHGRTGWSAR